MSRFPTATDVAYWHSRHVPSWAHLIPGRAPSIDAVVNSHAAARPDHAAMRVGNMLAILQMKRKRGVSMREALWGLTNCPADPRRATRANKWAARIAASQEAV